MRKTAGKNKSALRRALARSGLARSFFLGAAWRIDCRRAPHDTMHSA